MTHGQTIAKNAAWLMVATTAQKVISFLTFAVVAKLVGPEVTGKYFFAVSITSIFVGVADLGLTSVVIREMAASEERGRSVLAASLRAKFYLTPLAIFSSLAYILLTNSGRELILAVALSCFVMSADAVSMTWYGAIRGRQQLRFEAWGMFVGQCLTAMVSLTSVFLHAGVFGLIFGLLCGSTWNVGWSIWRARKLGVSSQAPIFPFKKLFIMALPFALAGIFVKVYSFTDTLLLKQFHGAIAVGYYSLAYKLTYSFQFLPLTFVAALYPGLSAAFASGDRHALQKIFLGSSRLMMILAIPLTVGLSALAPSFIPWIYGHKFLGSIAPLTILPWVTIPLFLDFPIGSLLNATHRAHQKTIAMGITMVINVLANVLLVPSFGPIGAAWAGVISFWILFFLGAWFARNDIDQRWAVEFFLRGLFTAGVCWFFLRLLAMWFPLIVSFFLGVVVIVILLFVMRIFLREDIPLIISWFQKKVVGVPTETIVES